jgi:hypothetical protein
MRVKVREMREVEGTHTKAKRWLRGGGVEREEEGGGA